MTDRFHFDALRQLLTEQRCWLPFTVGATTLSAALILDAEWLALLVIGLQTSVLVSFAVAPQSWPFDDRSRTTLLDIPFRLAHDADFFGLYERHAQLLCDISQQTDPIFRRLAQQRLAALNDEAAQIAAKTIVFHGTETWRIVYDQLLRSPGIHSYRSVAWAKNRHYWFDEPGRKSLQANYELVAADQLQIERIVILAEELWPADQSLPIELMRQWIHEQHHHGLLVKLVRESSLANEPDLLADIGLYGTRALGIQELDAECRTTRFTLTFDFDQLAAAESRWQRLTVYAAPYSSLLEEFWLPDESS